jgi:hypothetical protein
MLTMHAHGHTRRPGGHLRFQRRQVAAVHDVRAQPPEQRNSLGYCQMPCPGGLCSANELDVVTLDALPEVRVDFGQGQTPCR